MRSAPLPLLLLIALLAIPACRTGTDGVISTAADDVLNAPTATVVAAYVTRTSPRHASLDIVLALNNPQNIQLPVRFGDLRLATDAGTAPTLETRPFVTMPPNAVTQVTLRGVAPHDGSGLVGQPVRISGSLTYEPPGEVRMMLTDTGFPLPKIGFSESVTAQASTSPAP